MMLRSMLTRALPLLVLASSVVAGPLVIGHRGTGVSSRTNPYPENSLPSIAQGLSEGADLIEIDVQLARDGEVILWHDQHAVINGQKILVADLTRDQFPLLQGAQGLTAEVPSFRSALRLALRLGGPGKVMDIEVKIYRDQDRGPLAAAIAQVLREERAARKVMVASFDKRVLKLLEAELPGLESALLGVFRFTTLNAAKKMIEEGTVIEWVLPSKWAPFALSDELLAFPQAEAEAVEEIRLLKDTDLNPSMASYVKKAHQAGLRVGMWTVDDLDKMEDLVADGFDAFITDEPNLGRQAVDAGH